LKEFADRRAGDLVHVRVNNRFPSDDETISLLRRVVLNSMNTATGFRRDTFSVDLSTVGLSAPPCLDEALLRRELNEHLGTEHFNAIYIGKGVHLAALAVTSDKRDRVLTYIYKQLKHAAQQFSRQRPAVIWTFIEGIEPQEWRGLIGDTGLQRMSNRYMLGQHRQHVFSMAYSSTGHLVARDGHFQHTGPLMNYNRGELNSESSAKCCTAEVMIPRQRAQL
jgi:hypothetical protein